MNRNGCTHGIIESGSPDLPSPAFVNAKPRRRFPAGRSNPRRSMPTAAGEPSVDGGVRAGHRVPGARESIEGMVKVGIAGWIDKELISSGKFYPPHTTSSEDRLRYYASQFPLVEGDSTYSGLPSKKES